jgi:hypothetical protein
VLSDGADPLGQVPAVLKADGAEWSQEMRGSAVIGGAFFMFHLYLLAGDDKNSEAKQKWFW